MPGCGGETLAEIEKRIGGIANFAVYLMQYSVEGVLAKIFDGMELKLLDHAHPVYRCDCSRTRLKEVVESLGGGEIRDMIEKDGGAEITCRFCNKVYHFSAEELEKMIAKEKG
jgi:molecular chaperone Hsp33